MSDHPQDDHDVHENSPKNSGNNTVNRNSTIESAHVLKDYDEAVQLIKHLGKEKINPVIIIGVNTSGKTLIIHSILAYGSKQGLDFKVQRGSSAFPPGMPTVEERNAWADEFFKDMTPIYKSMKVPGGTQKPSSFFIPIDVDFLDTTTHFAFLDGKGEYFERDRVKDKNGSFAYGGYSRFSNEIIQIFTLYPNPLSVIFVAPAIDRKNENDEDFKFRREAVSYAIKVYKVHRTDKSADNLLLLFGKWDSVADPSDGTDVFAQAPEEAVRDRYTDWNPIYNEFALLKVGKNGSKAMMPYSAGWIRNSTQVIPHEKYMKTFDRFNRVLWNWLYGNVNKTDDRKRKVLCADVSAHPNDEGDGTSDFDRRYYKVAQTMMWIRR